MKIILSLILCAAVLCTGCTATQSTSACAAAKTAATNADKMVTATTNAVTGTQETLAAVPPTDPLRKVLEPKLAQLQGYLFEARLAATIARAAISQFCPEVPPAPVVAPVVTPTTQPAQ
jgi:hypothetical protein